MPKKPSGWDEIVAKGEKVSQKELNQLNEDAYWEYNDTALSKC